jgi:hypothetical protein
MNVVLEEAGNPTLFAPILVEFEAPWHVISLGHGDVPHGDLNAELAAIREQMFPRLLREQIVANELWARLDAADLSTWTNDDSLRLARLMIETVTVARDISAEEMTAAINAPWLEHWPPLPTLDEL